MRSQSGFLRSLRAKDAAALVVGCVIGVGIFRAAAPVAAHLSSAPLILAVWAVGGALSFCGALCYAELGAAYPKSGGDYVYITRAYGSTVGFLFGWTKLFVERIGTLAVLAFVFAEYLSYLAPLGPAGVKGTAIAVIAALSFANVVGVRVGARLQNGLTFLKVLVLLGIIGAGFWGLRGGGPQQVPLSAEGSAFGTLRAFGMALVFVIWTYGGWNESTYVAEEIRDPHRALPWSIFTGLAGVTALYLAVNFIYLQHVPVGRLADTPLVAAEVMRKMLGDAGAAAVSAGVALSALGALNGEILTGGRILFAVGRDHALFERLSGIHARFSTPAWALAFNAAGASVLVWAGTFERLVTYSTVVMSVFFGMTALAVIILRKREPDVVRPYRVWGYPVTPILFAAGMAFFVANVAWMQPREAILGFGLLLAGLPLYGLSRALARPASFGKRCGARRP